MSIVDGHLVDGPLVQTSAFGGAYAYEVRAGDRLLHAGTVPDLGAHRSFADPRGTPEQHRHHLTDVAVEEFTVRVPADQLTRETLGSVAVTLHRVKAAAPSRPLTERSLGDQYLEEMRPVVGLVGLPEWVLPSALAEAGKRTAQG